MSPPEDRVLTYWQVVWQQLKQRYTAIVGLMVLALFVVVGIYAPLLASSKPLAVHYDGVWYFPLGRYLFFSGFYTKYLDLFFNLLMFTFPLFIAAVGWCGSRLKWFWLALVVGQGLAFAYLIFFPLKDPAADRLLSQERQEVLVRVRRGEMPPKDAPQPGHWAFDLQYMNPYARLNLVLRYQQRKLEDTHLQQAYGTEYKEEHGQATIPTLWQREQANEERLLASYREQLQRYEPGTSSYQAAQQSLTWLQERRQWLEDQQKLLGLEVMPLLLPYHWEDDAGGELGLNRYLSWLELTRINHKNLVAALLFGIRVSLVVGIIAVTLALIIGIPIGAMAGYYGGTVDIVVCRLLEVWEAMPSFLMLLMIVAVLQSKSIFLVITIIGIFGWTSFSRYIRGEFFKQRHLAYVEAGRCLGFSDGYLIFRHILPNAIPPVLTLLPFAIMGAISSEAGLSFLGLGEEGSCSWGVLMDEGRTAFPGESYLLWPPAVLLTILLVATALVGDALRDALDPKMHRT